MVPEGLVSLYNSALYVPASFDLDGWEWVDGYVIDEKDQDGRTWEAILYPADLGSGRSKVKPVLKQGSHNIPIASWFNGKRPPPGYYPAELVDGCLCIDIEGGIIDQQ